MLSQNIQHLITKSQGTESCGVGCQVHTIHSCGILTLTQRTHTKLLDFPRSLMTVIHSWEAGEKSPHQKHLDVIFSPAFCNYDVGTQCIYRKQLLKQYIFIVLLRTVP